VEVAAKREKEEGKKKGNSNKETRPYSSGVWGGVGGIVYGKGAGSEGE